MDQNGGNSWSRILSITFELGKWVVIFLVLILLIHLFVATIFIVDGPSMEPNLHDKEVVLVNRLSYLISQPRRGDVAILRFPGDPQHSRYVKRIVGLPGDLVEIKNGKIYINNVQITESYLDINLQTITENISQIQLKTGEYFLVGDNRTVSSDSRIWGPARQEDLIGRVTAILIPLKSIGLVSKIYYQ